MTIKAIIDTTKPVQGDKYTIFIYVNIRGKGKRVIASKYHVLKTDFENGKVLNTNPNFLRINHFLKSECLRIETNAINNPRSTLKEILKKEDGSIEEKIKERDAPTITSFIEEYKQLTFKKGFNTQKGTSVAYNTRKAIRTYLNYIIIFHKQRPFNFDDVNTDLYNEFVTYLRYDGNDGDGFAENTISKAVELLRRIMELSWDKKLHDNRQSLKFWVPRYEGEYVFLDEKEIKLFMKKPLPPHLEQERQRFYIGYNFFLRFTDSIVIDRKSIITIGGKKYFSATPTKTKNQVIVPIFPKTLKYLESNNYCMPKTTNAESNKKLKKIGEIAEIDTLVTVTEIRKGEIIKTQFKKYELITTHTIRRSAATNYYLHMKKKGSVDLKSLQLLGGWKSISSLERYLSGLSKLENAVDAGKTGFFNR